METLSLLSSSYSIKCFDNFIVYGYLFSFYFFINCNKISRIFTVCFVDFWWGEWWWRAIHFSSCCLYYTNMSYIFFVWNCWIVFSLTNEGVYTFGLFLLRLSALAYFLLPDLCALYAWVLFSLYLAIIYISTVGDVLYCYQIIYLVRDRERGEFKAVIVNVSL